VIPMKKIRVENLGVIKEGEVDINKPLTIFTGPNNSGKSYMAYLAYGYYRTVEPNSRFQQTLYLQFKDTQIQAFKEEQVLDKYFHANGISINYKDFSKNYYNEINSQLVSHVIERNSPEIFASNMNFKCEFIIESFFINRAIESNVNLNGINYFYKEHNGNIEITLHTPITKKQKKDIAQFIYSKVGYFSVSYFFPAERSSIHLFHKEIFKQKAAQRDELAKVIQNGNDIENAIKTFQKNGTLIPRYPLAINDYLTFASDFEYFAKQPKTKFEDLAKELETILGGRISVNPFGSLEFKPKGTRKNLPLHLSSSMVKSLGGLVVYLRHLAREHDHIIIDEPELNLHPSTQVKLARLLAKIANRGIKLLISTHSDYIISELSNLMLMSNDFKGKKALQKKYRYKKDDFIKTEDVGVYAFQNETIEPIPITDQGIEIDKIRKVIADMNLRSDDIYYIHLDSLEDAPI